MKHLALVIPFILILICHRTLAQDDCTVITQVVDSYPVLSPDGNSILFSSNRTGIYQIYICNPDGTNIVQLTQMAGDTGIPIWSPDGQKILYSSNIDNNSEIYIMNADGTEPKKITNQPGDDSHAKFSPDGQSIIFNSARTTPDLSGPWLSQFIELYTMDTNGNNLKQITSFNSICTYPSFSPDGSKIVFRRITRDPGLNWALDSISVNSEIFVIMSDGNMPVNISNSEAYDGWPLWMPDNETIIFTSNRGGLRNKGQLYSVKYDGTNLARITDLNNSFIQASVSKDGQTILAQRNWETETYEYGHIVSINIR